MPELPEVETIKRQLNNKLRGKVVKGVKIILAKIVKYPAQDFKKLVRGKKIEQVLRRAKLLIIKLSGKYDLLIHLKMTGQLILSGEENKYTHVIFYFTDGTYLIFNDLRQFGFIKLIKDKDLAGYLEKEKYGPELFSKEFTLDYLKDQIKQKKKSLIKNFLVDQTNIAGIGNIYSDEILFCAGVLPTRRAQSLKETEIRKIYKCILNVLTLATKKRGSSNKDYFDAHGNKGEFQKFQHVYRREGKTCSKCKSIIKRIKIGSRSAHFCPKCQH